MWSQRNMLEEDFVAWVLSEKLKEKTQLKDKTHYLIKGITFTLNFN